MHFEYQNDSKDMKHTSFMLRLMLLGICIAGRAVR